MAVDGRLGACFRRLFHLNGEREAHASQTHSVDRLQPQGKPLEVFQIPIIERLIHESDPTVPLISVVTGDVTTGARLSIRTMRAMY